MKNHKKKKNKGNKRKWKTITKKRKRGTTRNGKP
jgi:hypothetical protein